MLLHLDSTKTRPFCLEVESQTIEEWQAGKSAQSEDSTSNAWTMTESRVAGQKSTQNYIYCEESLLEQV